MIKYMKSKMTTNSNYQQLHLKKQKQKHTKQTEQEQNHRNGDQVEDYQWGGVRGRIGEKVQGIRSINCRYKTDKGRLRIV